MVTCGVCWRVDLPAVVSLSLSVVIFVKNTYLEELLQTRISYFFLLLLDIMMGLLVCKAQALVNKYWIFYTSHLRRLHDEY